MTADEPRRTYRTELHQRDAMLRIASLAALVLFIFLVGYFALFGPLDPQDQAVNPAAGPNIDAENKAAPSPQPSP